MTSIPHPRRARAPLRQTLDQRTSLDTPGRVLPGSLTSLIFFFSFFLSVFAFLRFRFFRNSFCSNATSLFFGRPLLFRLFFSFSKLRFDFRFLFCFPLFRDNGILLGGPEPPSTRRTDGSSPLRDHRIISRRRFLSEVWPSRVSFFLVRAGSFLDSARRQSGVLVKFLYPPRSFLIGKNAAATSQPSLLVAGLWPQLCRDVIRGAQKRAAACPHTFLRRKVRWSSRKLG